jgi:hypothetical protein
VYAEIIWYDRPTSGGINGGGALAVNGVVGTITASFYNEPRPAIDVRDGKTYRHIRDVTSFIQANRNFVLQLAGQASVTRLDEEWDNVQLTVCFDIVIGGDPHFTTWKGGKFSYHGACDLALLHSDQFGNGLGMDIHIRTKHRRNFSYISHLALRIGTDIFEVAGKDHYYLNGIDNAPLPNQISGYVITHSVNPHTGYPMYTIHVSDAERIIIKSWKDIVSIAFEGETEENYGDAVGLMGSFHTGKKLGRDGVRVFHHDINAYGQEWQVQVDEPHLFQTLEAASTMCTLPDSNEAEKLLKRRRLGESISEEAAKKACEHVGAEDMDFCMFDVMSTGDVDMASTYVY